MKNPAKAIGWKTLTIMALMFSMGYTQVLYLAGQTGYRPSTLGAEYGVLESVSAPDSGGYVTCLVRNNSGLPLSIAGIAILQGADTLPVLSWMAWPMLLPSAGAPGNPWSWITVKGLGHPFQEGDTFSIRVRSNTGSWSNRLPVTCTESPLVIGHVVSGPDDKGLEIYLRNTRLTGITIDTVHCNQWTWNSPGSGGIRVTGGSASADPDGMLILHLLEDSVFRESMPITLRVHWKETAGSAHGWAVSGLRLVGNEPILGTWHSSGMNPDKEYGRKRLRTLSLGAMQGPGTDAFCSNGFAEYYIKTIREPSFGSGSGPDTSIAGPLVRMLRDSTWMQCWSIDDEPDLNSKPVPDEVMKNVTYLLNDPGTPTFVNLAVQHKFNRYAWFSDMVAQDHYSAADAPNIIPNTWIPFIGREGKLDEAVEYLQVIKQNAEPRRILAWSQLNSGVWSSQPQPHSVDHQFWGQVMAGAKGILWFTTQSDLADDQPALWARSQEISQQWTGIRELLMHCEPSGEVLTSTPDVMGGLLVGEEAAVLIILNQTVDFSFNSGTLSWNSIMDTVYYHCTIRLPAWISPGSVRMLTPAGLIPQPGLVALGGGLYQFTPTDPIRDRSHVFIIGGPDTQAPQTPGVAQIPEFIDLANYTISWPVSRDNRGIAGYEIAWNGVVADTVPGPVFEVRDGDFNCVTGNWSIRAIDLEGNVSSPTFLPITISIPSPVIAADPMDIGVPEGVDTFFTVSATGDGLNYRWQMQTAGLWSDLPELPPFSGTQTDTLWIMGSPDSLDNRSFRCIVANPCLVSDTSQTATLSVYVGLDETASQWEIFPNPTDGIWHFRGPLGSQAAVTLITTTGNILLHKDIQSGETLTLEGLPAGIYLMEIESAGNRSRLRVQVLH